jgi:hypothetical protein
VHYDKALWLQRHRSREPLPSRVDRFELALTVAGALVVLIAGAPHFVRLWSDGLANLSSAAADLADNPDEIRVGVGYLATLACDFAVGWTVLLAWSPIPMVPAHRILAIQVGLLISFVSLSLLGAIWLEGWAIERQSQSWSLVNGLIDLPLVGVLSAIYVGAIRGHRRDVRKYWPSVILGGSVLYLLANAIAAAGGYQESPTTTVAAIVVFLVVSLIVIPRKGRMLVAWGIDLGVARLADTTSPLDREELARLDASSRTEALRKAALSLASLTPSERTRLMHFLADGPSFGPGRFVTSVLVLFAAALFVQAPAARTFSAVYSGVVCQTLRAGSPWCP